jgi:6-phosphogluconolactonase
MEAKNSISLAMALGLIILLGLFLTSNKKQKTEKTLIFVGSFTDKNLGEGIHVYDFDNETGETVLKFSLDSVINTSFLRLSSNGKYLYSVVESQMEHHGKIAAFEVDSIHDQLKFINIQDCGGINPAHIEIDKTGNFLAVSNYSDGSLSMFTINSNGSLNQYGQLLRFKDSSIVKNRQEASHIHSSNFSPDNEFLFTQDLGADKIRVFNMHSKNQEYILQDEKHIILQPGSGPRHFTFHPNGKYGYSIAELSGKITVFNYQNGHLEFIEDYQSYKQKQEIYRAADIHISPDGKFLYATNRGPNEDSISIFSINKDNGSLVLIGHEPTYGEHPRNFAISHDGNFLLVANQFSNKVAMFKRNLESGKLSKLSQEIHLKNPSSIQMYTYKFRID